ncbi:type IX secretion system outer membrane channel protein PorV [Hymenobacter persicinus]|uniref:Type IX secretion system outer membrane channel protein PorV n=1 Tax=Hymenobacter persicinus TaxID=2025506 RepID=A0A4Q5LED9_9BACT|nr:type IX secretion system outer membrane channel protein PorV [Hymenobacter persicinus]RYU80801.1 type IX secretion system outer membrane channel protein PorV [Hymenobacter persicinus]
MTSSKLPLRVVLLPGLLGLSFAAAAQTDPKTITTAVPILTISPDARSSALGDASVAISPDANSAFYNAGKLGFVKNKYSFSPSYSPWLRAITDDMGIAGLSGYAKIGQRSAVSGSLTYFDLGTISFRDERNNDNGNFNPKEYAVALSYGQKLSDNFGVGVTTRFIHSNLTGNSISTDAKPGNSVAVDLGAYYTKDLTIGPHDYNLALGGAISNIGTKMTYTDPTQADFLPTNLKLGTAITRELDAYNKITFTVDANKLLVPSRYYENGVAANDTVAARRNKAKNDEIRAKSVVSGIFGSFSDAPGGFKEELQEINLSAGMEYWYNDLLAARVGYFYENKNKGDRQYLSFGLGVRYQVFGVDGSYLVPNSRQNPLAQTIRVSLHFNFNKLEEAFGPGNDSSPVN